MLYDTNWRIALFILVSMITANYIQFHYIYCYYIGHVMAQEQGAYTAFDPLITTDSE